MDFLILSVVLYSSYILNTSLDIINIKCIYGMYCSCVIKILLFFYLNNNNLITYCYMSNNFIFYFTITLDIIQYHLSLMDGMFKLVYAFPTSWTMQPSTFWIVTLSIAVATLNGAFFFIKYDLNQISLIKDQLFEYYNVPFWDKCCVTLKLKSIEYSAKFLVFVPIFIVVNTITCGLSVIMVITESCVYSVFFGVMWIFGIYISWIFRKCKINFFADLVLYILLMNFIAMINVSIITATMWSYGHHNGLVIGLVTSAPDGNLILDDHYHFYTLSAWILYIVMFIVMYPLMPVI